MSRARYACNWCPRVGPWFPEEEAHKHGPPDGWKTVPNPLGPNAPALHFCSQTCKSKAMEVLTKGGQLPIHSDGDPVDLVKRATDKSRGGSS